MIENGAGFVPERSYIEKLKASRKSPAVLKVRLAKIRGARPRSIIFAFEGDTDKAVYFQWVRRIRPDLNYEPFPCDGKSEVFQFQDMLERDKGELQRGVYFFIDRDFDDSRGREIDARTFMTDRYSVENYLVGPWVLEELLKDEFHCHAEPIIRANILETFCRQLAEFLALTREVNYRVFVARRLGLKIGDLSVKTRRLAKIELTSVSQADDSASDVVVFNREPTREELEKLAAEFETLDPSSRYRGKFNYAFFMKWLQLLASERAHSNSLIFGGLTERRINYAGITVGMLASKSLLPEQLGSFIDAVTF
jgi:hypothetical protein